MLKIHQFVFGPVQENTYVLYDEDTREAAIVDPGCMRRSEEEKLRAFIVEKELSPQLMLCTHQHFDHVWGAAYVLRTWASIAAYGNRIDFEQLPLPSEQLRGYGIPLPLEDVPMQRYTLVGQGDTIQLGERSYVYSLSQDMLQGTLPFMPPTQDYYSRGIRSS